MDPFSVHKHSSLQVKPGISVGNAAPVPGVVSASHVPYNLLPTANNFPPQDIQRLGQDYVRENRNFIFGICDNWFCIPTPICFFGSLESLFEGVSDGSFGF